jgi:hypothetical protein
VTRCGHVLPAKACAYFSLNISAAFCPWPSGPTFGSYHIVSLVLYRISAQASCLLLPCVSVCPFVVSLCVVCLCFSFVGVSRFVRPPHFKYSSRFAWCFKSVAFSVDVLVANFRAQWHNTFFKCRTFTLVSTAWLHYPFVPKGFCLFFNVCCVFGRCSRPGLWRIAPLLVNYFALCLLPAPLLGTAFSPCFSILFQIVGPPAILCCA